MSTDLIQETPTLAPGQTYRFRDGTKNMLISIVPDDQTIDPTLVFLPENGLPHQILSAVDFMGLKPELVH